MKVLVALRFFATGGTLRDVGDLHRISKATAGQIVSNVSKWFCTLQGHITFPNERLDIYDKAYTK